MFPSESRGARREITGIYGAIWVMRRSDRLGRCWGCVSGEVLGLGLDEAFGFFRRSDSDRLVTVEVRIEG